MTNNARVFNVTRRFSLKYKQALKAIENCACTWVEGKIGLEIRDLTFAEAVMARKESAVNRPLGLFYWVEVVGRDGKPKMVARPIFTELPTFHVKWSTVQQQTLHRQGIHLVRAANQFAESAA